MKGAKTGKKQESIRVELKVVKKGPYGSKIGSRKEGGKVGEETKKGRREKQCDR